MPNWQKLIRSGSNAALDRLFVSTSVTASNGFSGSLSGTASWATSASWAPNSPGVSDSLGTGFTSGGGTGSIVNGTQVLVSDAEFRTIQNADSFRSGMLWNHFFPSNTNVFNKTSGSILIYCGNPSSSNMSFIQGTAEEAYIEFGSNYYSSTVKYRNYIKAANSSIEFGTTSQSLNNTIQASAFEQGIRVSTENPSPKGLVYNSDYGATLYSNIRSIPDVGTIQTYLTASYSITASYTSEVRSFGITIDGGGSAITTGIKGDVTIPFNGNITGWYLTSDQIGSIVIDVWKDTFANFPPTAIDSIAGTEKPTLSSALSGSDLSLTTWTSSLSTGDVVRFNVDSVSTVTRVNLVIKCIT